MRRKPKGYCSAKAHRKGGRCESRAHAESTSLEKVLRYKRDRRAPQVEMPS